MSRCLRCTISPLNRKPSGELFRDMQDMEFTSEDGHLYMLQTRNGKRTAQAALQIACDLVDEGMITEREAVLRVEPKQLDTLLHPQFDAAALKAAEVVGKGLAASPVLPAARSSSPQKRLRRWSSPARCLRSSWSVWRPSPEDIVGMQVSQGILTVARRHEHQPRQPLWLAAWAPAVSPAAATTTRSRSMRRRPRPSRINGHKFVEGDWISLDGSTGNIYGEQVATVAATPATRTSAACSGWAERCREVVVMDGNGHGGGSGHGYGHGV